MYRHAIFVFPVFQNEQSSDKWRACLIALNERNFQLFWASTDAIPLSYWEVLAVPIDAQTPERERTASAIVEARARLTRCMQLSETMEINSIMEAQMALDTQYPGQMLFAGPWEGAPGPEELPDIPDDVRELIDQAVFDIVGLSPMNIAADVTAGVTIHILSSIVPAVIEATAETGTTIRAHAAASALVAPISQAISNRLLGAITNIVEYSIADAMMVCETKDHDAGVTENGLTDNIMEIIANSLAYNVADCITDDMLDCALGFLMDAFARADTPGEVHDYVDIINSAADSITGSIGDLVGDGIAQIIADAVGDAMPYFCSPDGS